MMLDENVVEGSAWVERDSMILNWKPKIENNWEKPWALGQNRAARQNFNKFLHQTHKPKPVFILGWNPQNFAANFQI